MFSAGLVAMGGPETLLSTSTALSAFQVPVVNVRPDFYSDLSLGRTSNVLTTAPDLGAQARVRTESLLDSRSEIWTMTLKDGHWSCTERIYYLARTMLLLSPALLCLK